MQGLAPTEKRLYLATVSGKQVQQEVLTQTLGYHIRFDLSAKERLWQEKYPDMAVVERPASFLEGHIADNELDFLADFLLQFGPTIKEIEPLVLKQAYTEKFGRCCSHLQLTDLFPRLVVDCLPAPKLILTDKEFSTHVSFK